MIQNRGNSSLKGFSKSLTTLTCNTCHTVYVNRGNLFVRDIDGRRLCSYDAPHNCGVGIGDRHIHDGCLYCGRRARGQWFFKRESPVTPLTGHFESLPVRLHVTSVLVNGASFMYRTRVGDQATASWGMQYFHSAYRPATKAEIAGHTLLDEPLVGRHIHEPEPPSLNIQPKPYKAKKKETHSEELRRKLAARAAKPLIITCQPDHVDWEGEK